MRNTKEPFGSKKVLLSALPDKLDFRDKIFEPTLVEVPVARPLSDYLKAGVPLLDQGQEGACTGFGLATVVNYLLISRKYISDPRSVSPWMLYRMARRYDEWPGEDYEGSSARGAMKGWHKHGVCSIKEWDKATKEPTGAVYADAVNRPLGAYYRVNHKDLVAMHCAITETGILYATAMVHGGWDAVKKDGIIHEKGKVDGGHAFAIVAFDKKGFWIQNSWGKAWGKNGFCRISYDDWLKNGTDVWVARLGAPVEATSLSSVATRFSRATSYTDAQSNFELRKHIISLGNDGVLDGSGEFGTSNADLDAIFNEYIPQKAAEWGGVKRIVLYAHGGLVDEEGAVKVLAEKHLALFEGKKIYPIHFIWHTGFFTTLGNIIKDNLPKMPAGGFRDDAANYFADRWDDSIERLARGAGGGHIWAQMKQNAESASNTGGGAALAVDKLRRLVEDGYEIHLVGHSAGSIFHAYLAQALITRGVDIRSITLWAPACTTDIFMEKYLPLLGSPNIKSPLMTLFTLSEQAEMDDNCAEIYRKSLLYLVANALDKKARPFLSDKVGTPLLGMARCVKENARLAALFRDGRKCSWVVAPSDSSGARGHAEFDDDRATILATIERILEAGTEPTPVPRGGGSKPRGTVIVKNRGLPADRDEPLGA